MRWRRQLIAASSWSIAFAPSTRAGGATSAYTPVPSTRYKLSCGRVCNWLSLTMPLAVTSAPLTLVSLELSKRASRVCLYVRVSSAQRYIYTSGCCQRRIRCSLRICGCNSRGLYDLHFTYLRSLPPPALRLSCAAGVEMCRLLRCPCISHVILFRPALGDCRVERRFVTSSSVTITGCNFFYYILLLILKKKLSKLLVVRNLLVLHGKIVFLFVNCSVPICIWNSHLD